MVDAHLSQVVDQLLERYSGEWETTRSRLFGTNFGALRAIFHSSRLGSVTNIVICGLGTGGTLDEQARNASLTLDDQYLEYSQRIFFTQIGVARLVRDLLQERHQVYPITYACDPVFTQHDVAVLRNLNIGVIPTANREQIAWHDRGTLIYDVTQDTVFAGQRIDYTWDRDRTPPAAILTCLTALVRDRVAPRFEDPPKEVNPAFLRKYYMVPIMDLHTETVPSSAERHTVNAIQDPDEQSAARAELRERESRLTQRGYERMLVNHSAIMDQFQIQRDRRISELRQHYQALRDGEGYRKAKTQADQELTPHTPQNTNSYVYDPMMVLLYRKPAATA